MVRFGSASFDRRRRPYSCSSSSGHLALIRVADDESEKSRRVGDPITVTRLPPDVVFPARGTSSFGFCLPLSPMRASASEASLSLFFIGCLCLPFCAFDSAVYRCNHNHNHFRRSPPTPSSSSKGAPIEMVYKNQVNRQSEIYDVPLPPRGYLQEGGTMGVCRQATGI